MFGSGGVQFEPLKDIPDLSGKVFLVTGGSSGLGEETVMQLAKHSPSQIYLAARDEERANVSIHKIKQTVPDANITFIFLDLSSLQSVAEAAKTVNASTERLDVLINNAGIMAVPPAKTKNGYEIQFGTNHVGHALLTKLLLPKLLATAEKRNADVRIISLTSAAHNLAPKGGLLLDEVRSDMSSTYTFVRYGQSKLANILYSNELARRYPSIRCIAVHPGVVNTGLQRGVAASHPWLTKFLKFVSNWLMVPVEKGVHTQLWAATSQDARTGKYYVPFAKENAGTAYVQDEKLQGKLWEWTEKELASFN